MAKKRAKTVDSTEPATDRFFARLESRVPDGTMASVGIWIMIIQALLELFQNCPAPEPAKITRRIARCGRWKQARMANKLQAKAPDMSDADAAAIVAATVAEARKNPRDTARMVAEGLAEMKEA